LSAPTSSFEMDALTEKAVPISLDTLLLKDSAAANQLKEITFSDLESAILSGAIISINGDTTNAQIIAAGTGLGIVDIGNTHTLSIDGTVVTLLGIQTLEFKTLLIPAIADFTNAQHDHETAAGGGQLTATDALDATGTKDSTTFLRGDNTYAVPPGAGVSAPFTWGASDEDSPLSVALLYTTEAAASEITLSTVILSLKNPPTGSTITVDILKETAVNSNIFATIFSTLPTIDINEFTSQTAAVAAIFSDTTWEIERRLQLVLTITDTNFAATGLKVTLA